MGKQYEMAFSIGAKVQGSFGSAFKSAASSVQSLQTTINELNKKQSDIASYQKTQQALDQTRNKLKLYEQQYANMKAAIEGNENATYQEQNAMLAKAKAIDDLKAKQEGLEQKLRTTGDALREEGVDLDNLGNESQATAQQVEELRNEQEALAESSGSAAQGIMELVSALGAMEALKAVAAAFQECAEQAIAFENNMAAVKRTVGGSDSFITSLGEDFKKLSTQIPITTEELTQIAATAGQLGIQQDKVEQFTTVMAKLATTTDLSADSAATMLAQFANITGVDDYERLGATIADLGDSTATTASKVVEMSQGMAAAASVAGFKPTDIMALSAAVGSLGIESQAGSTAMSQLISTLYKATETGEKLEQFAAVAGMSADQFKTAWGQDAVGTMNEFITGLNNVERNGKSAIVILDELGINNVRQQKAILGLANAGELLSNTIAKANSAWTANTALNQKAAIMYETTQAKLTMMNNAFDNVKVSIGDAFTPIIGAAADALTGLMEPVAEFIEENPALVQGIGAAMAVMGGFTAAIVAYTAATKLATTITAAFGAATGAALGPILAIAAAIAGVVGVATALAAAFGDSKKSMAELDTEFDTMNAKVIEQQGIVDMCERYKALASDATTAVEATKGLSEFPDIQITLTADPVDDIQPVDFMQDEITDVELTPVTEDGSLLETDDLIADGADKVEMTPEAGDTKLDAEDLMSTTGVKITAEGPDSAHKLDANVFVNGKKVQFQAEWSNRDEMLKDVEAFKQAAVEAQAELTTARTTLDELKKRKSQITERIWHASSDEDLSSLQEELANVTEKVIQQEAEVSKLEKTYEDAAGKYVITAEAAEALAEKDTELAEILNALGISAENSTGSIEEQTAAILAQVNAAEQLAQANIAAMRADIYGNVQEQAKKYAATMAEVAEYQKIYDRAVADSEVTQRYAGKTTEEITERYKELLNTLDAMEEAEGFDPTSSDYASAIKEANDLYNIISMMQDDWSEYAGENINWADSFAYVAGNAAGWNQIVADINEDIAAYGAAIADADSETKLFLDNLVEGVKSGAVEIDEVETLLTEAFANEENGAELLARAMEYVRNATQEATDAQESMAEEQANLNAAVDPIIAKMAELSQAYTDAYNAAYESINGQFKLFEKVTLEDESDKTKTSVDDMINSLKSQSDYMTEYAANLQAASKMGIDEGLLAKLSDGSTESARYLQEIVTNGSSKIDELNNAFKKVEDGKKAFADTVAEMQTNFSASMKQLETDLQNTINTMDKSAETAASGSLTVSSYAEGALSQLPAVQAAFQTLSNAAQIKASVSFSFGGFSFGGLGKLFGFAGGTDNAPRGWAMVGEEGPELMYLHGGERILNAQDTQSAMSNTPLSAASSGGSSGGSIVVEYKPQYNISGAMNADDLRSVLEEHDSNVRGQIEDILRDIDTDRYRREYA